MWSRRRFLETVSAVPLVGGFIAAGAAPGGRRRPQGAGLLPRAGRAAVHQRGRDLHGDDRLADAARSDGRDQLRLQALRDARRAARQGRRADRHAGPRRGGDGHVGRRLRADAGHGGSAHRQRPAEDRRSAEPRRHEERSHHPEVPPLRLRPRRPQLRRTPGRGRDARGPGARGQREDRDDALLQQQQQGRADPGRGVRPAWQEARHPDASTTPPPTCRRSRTSGSTPAWASTWWRSPAARASAGRRAPACCSAARTSSRRPGSTRLPTATRSAAA